MGALTGARLEPPGQLGWGVQQPGTVQGVLARGLGGTGSALRSLPTQTLLGFDCRGV